MGLRRGVAQVATIGIDVSATVAMKKFDEKYGLGFTLASDAEHAIAENFGVWVLKKNYGKEYMGVQRSAFLVDEHGKIERAWPKISPKDTPTNLLAALAT